MSRAPIEESVIDHAPEPAPEPAPEREYAEDVLPGRLMVILGVVTIAVVVASVVVSTVMLRVQDPLTSSPHPVPAPRGTVERSLILTTDRGGVLKTEQRARLETYGWADRDAGLAHVPIARAMEIVVQDAARPVDAGRKDAP